MPVIPCKYNVHFNLFTLMHSTIQTVEAHVMCVLILWILSTNFKLSLWIPYDQVSIIARSQAALQAVEATQVGCFLAEQSHHIRQLKASFTG